MHMLTTSSIVVLTIACFSAQYNMCMYKYCVHCQLSVHHVIITCSDKITIVFLTTFSTHCNMCTCIAFIVACDQHMFHMCVLLTLWDNRTDFTNLLTRSYSKMVVG